MTTNGRESKRRLGPQREQLTWLRVRVPGRRLAETRGHEYIVLGRCKKKKNKRKGIGITLCIQIKMSTSYTGNGGVGWEGEHETYPNVKEGTAVLKKTFSPSSQGGNRFLRLCRNLHVERRQQLVKRRGANTADSGH